MNGKTFKEYFLRAVALLGLLAVLLLGAWGIIQIAFFISSLFNNGGPEPRTNAPETITLSLPPSALAGQSVTVRWTHSGGDGAYAYALAYSCAPGLSFKAQTPAGTQQTVPCDTAFNFMSATSSMVITPAASSTATTTITVMATKLSTGQITASTRGSLEIRTAASSGSGSRPSSSSGTTAKPSTSKPTQKSVSAGRTTGLYGMPDLAVYITSITSVGGNATVQFTVENVGTNVAPAGWNFNAHLPINGSYTYPAGAQQALYPGGKIAFTLAYGDYDSGYYGSSFSTCNKYGPCNIPTYPYGYPNYPYYPDYGYTRTPYDVGYSYNQKMVTIHVDPYNQVYDLNRSNNSATMPYTPR